MTNLIQLLMYLLTATRKAILSKKQPRTVASRKNVTTAQTLHTHNDQNTQNKGKSNTAFSRNTRTKRYIIHTFTMLRTLTAANLKGREGEWGEDVATNISPCLVKQQYRDNNICKNYFSCNDTTRRTVSMFQLLGDVQNTSIQLNKVLAHDKINTLCTVTITAAAAAACTVDSIPSAQICFQISYILPGLFGVGVKHCERRTVFTNRQ